MKWFKKEYKIQFSKEQDEKKRKRKKLSILFPFIYPSRVRKTLHPWFAMLEARIAVMV
jgi:hypothetical protein